MKKLYSFFWDVRRMGSVEGLFIATDEEIMKGLGKDVYFGEILGKHSEVDGVLEEGDLTVMSESQDFIEELERVVGGRTVSGYNPLNYIDNWGG